MVNLLRILVMDFQSELWKVENALDIGLRDPPNKSRVIDTCKSDALVQIAEISEYENSRNSLSQRVHFGQIRSGIIACLSLGCVHAIGIIYQDLWAIAKQVRAECFAPRHWR